MPSHNPPSQLLHQVAEEWVRIMVAEIISTKTSDVTNKVLKGLPGAVDPEVALMLKGEVVRDTFMLHQDRRRLRLLLWP